MKNNKINRILFAGPLPIEGDVIGGTKVSFDILVKELQRSDELIPIIHNTSRKLEGASKARRVMLNLLGLLSLCISLCLNRKHSKYFVWNISAHGLLSSGTLIWILTKILRYRVILRIFGGDFADVFYRQSKFKRWLHSRTIMSFDKVLVQSKALVSELSDFNNVHWFPTTRTTNDHVTPRQGPCTNFIYVGQLKEEKGLDVVCEVIKDLGNKISFTACGPEVTPGLANKLKESGAIVLGQIPFNKVEEEMANADVFVFLTRYHGEGYPGAVIESLQMGAPVITTDWKYMTEIVEDGKSGLVVKNSRDELKDAILRLTDSQALFEKLSQGAIERGKQFETSSAVSRLLTFINE